MKKKYNVTGMMCAACQANVDHAVCKIDGVNSVNVSLLANNMVVDFDESKVSDETINTISDKELEEGETGRLIEETEFGEPVKKEEKKTKKVKVPKKAGIFNIAWTKLKNTALDFYDDENKEE